jgi:hypothetical protein
MQAVFVIAKISAVVAVVAIGVRVSVVSRSSCSSMCVHSWCVGEYDLGVDLIGTWDQTSGVASRNEISAAPEVSLSLMCVKVAVTKLEANPSIFAS